MGIWTDITVSDADKLKDFYTQVFGWTVEEVAMEDEVGSYVDYAMVDKDGNGVGGICNKRGVNKDLPSQWIVYFTVRDAQKSVETCLKLGGNILKESRNEDGEIFYALIEDPSGAVVAFMQEEP